MNKRAEIGWAVSVLTIIISLTLVYMITIDANSDKTLNLLGTSNLAMSCSYGCSQMRLILHEQVRRVDELSEICFNRCYDYAVRKMNRSEAR